LASFSNTCSPVIPSYAIWTGSRHCVCIVLMHCRATATPASYQSIDHSRTYKIRKTAEGIISSLYLIAQMLEAGIYTSIRAQTRSSGCSGWLCPWFCHWAFEPWRRLISMPTLVANLPPAHFAQFQRLSFKCIKSVAREQSTHVHGPCCKKADNAVFNTAVNVGRVQRYCVRSSA